MSNHELKTWPEFWLSLETGAKTFEVRRNDRSFQPADDLVLREWDPRSEAYTGRWMRRRVSYVLRDAERFGLQDGFVVLGLAHCCDKCGDPIGYVLCDPCLAASTPRGDAMTNPQSIEPLPTALPHISAELRRMAALFEPMVEHYHAQAAQSKSPHRRDWRYRAIGLSVAIAELRARADELADDVEVTP